MTKLIQISIFLILMVILMFSGIHAQDEQLRNQPTPDPITPEGQTYNCITQDGITIYDLSVDDKRALRRQLMAQFISNYNENHTFEKINQYMILKYQEMNRTKTPKYPDILIQETFEKSNNLFTQTRKFFGNSFTRVYDPEMIEKKVRKYLWLRGLYFWLLGINDEHRLAISYFYLSGNEEIKHDFLKKAIRFSYPEVPECEGNQAWQTKMVEVMDRLGYDIFNVKKFGIPPAGSNPTPNP